MKKIYKLLLLMVALICLPLSVSADDLTLTVMDGDYYQQSVPLDGYNLDGAQHNQFLLLSSELSAMDGSNIKGLTFYFDKTGYSWSNTSSIPTVTFRLKEVDFTSLASQVTVDETFTQVYSGTIDFSFSDKVWNITFTTPYSYKGGNLLIDLQTATAGSTYVKMSGSSKMRYYTSYITGRAMKGSTAFSYCPKTTFTYEEAAVVGGCNKPKNLTLSTSTPDAATFTWEQNVDETTYQWACVEKDVEVTSWNTLEAGIRTKTIEGLTSGTPYDFLVRSYCGDGENEQSEAVKKTFSVTCPAPTFPTTPVTELSASGATVTWNAVDGISKYQYLCVVRDADTTGLWATVEAKEGLSAELTSLTAKTHYDFYVRSWYSATSISDAVKTTFRTDADCSAIVVDADHTWEEDFSGFEVGNENSDAPDCWALLNANAGSRPYIYISASGTTWFSLSNNALYFSNVNTKYGYAIFPAFATALNTLQITFDQKVESASSSGAIELGYMTNITDESTFNLLLSCNKSTSWKSENVILTAVPAGARLAFRYKATSSSYFDAAVDNIVVSLAPACAKPTGLEYSEKAAHSVKLSWTSDASAWKVEYSKNSDFSESTVKNVTENPYVLDGLDANTHYYVRVSTDCGAGGESDPTAAIDFTTKCEDATLPFAEDFEGGALPECWLADSRWAINTNAHAGSYCARYSSGGKGDLVLPSITLDDDAMLFYWHASSSPTGAVLVNGTSVQSIATTSGNWKKDSVDLSAYNGQNVVITFTSSYSTYSNRYLYIDDIAVTYKPVAVPTNLVAAQGNTTATITWESAEGTSWNLRYRVVGAEEWITENGLTEKTKVLEGLTNGTTYEAQVQAVVSANRQSAWTESVTFTPENCPTVLKISLASATYNSIVVSWTTSGEGTWDLDYRIGENPWTERHGLSEKTLTLEELETGVEYTVQVGPSCGEQYVDTTFTLVYSEPVAAEAENITDESATVQWIGVIDTDTYEYAFVLPGDEAVWTETKALTATATGLAPATDYLFVVRAKYPTGVSGNDTTEFATITIAPQNLVQVGESTTDGATFSWEANGAATKYQWSTDNATWSEAQTALTATVTGLNAGTSYTFYVRSYYSETVQSAAISLPFTTECASVTIGWEENFGSVSGTKPNCWNIANWGTSSNSWTTASDFAKTGQALRYNARTLSSADAITPSITIPEKAELKFYIKNSVGSSSAKVQCKVLVNDGTTTTELTTINTRYTAATLQTLDLSDYEGKTVTIIFRGVGYDTSGSPYLWIDDVTVTFAPIATPTALDAAATADGAVVTWESTEGASWNLRYRAVGAEDWTLVEGLTEKTKTLTGLTEGTTYEVQVQAVASANCVSEWTASATFTPQTCADVETVTFGAKTYNSVVVYWTVTAAGTWDLHYKAGEGEWTLVENIDALTYTLTGLTTNAVYTVEVKPSCSDAWVAAATTFTPVYTAPVSAEAEDITDHSAKVQWLGPNDATGYEYDFVIPGETAAWKETTELFATADELLAGTDYLLVVRSIYPTGVSEADTTEFATITIAPQNLAQIGESTTSSATFTWEANGAATKWQWSTDNATWSEPISVLTATVDELEASTTYTFYVRSYYSETVQSAAISLQFSTACAVATMPFAENFEAGIPVCWETTGTWTADGNYIHTGSYAARFNAKNANGTLTLPRIAISEEDATLVFFFRNVYGGSSYIPVTVSVEAEGHEKFERSLLNAKEDDLHEQRIDLSTYNGEIVTITFSVSSVSSSAAFYLDDVTVDKKPENPATGIDNTDATGKATKRLENNMLIIELNGVQYNAQGQLLKK